MSHDAAAAPAKKGGAAAEMIEIIKTVLFALVIALLLRVLLFQPYTIPSGSMEPNLYEGDYIIVSKYSYGYSKHSIPLSPPLFDGRIFFHAPKRGDIIVFKEPRDPKIDVIKRLIGLPGDRVQIRSGVVFINGKAIDRQAMAGGATDMGYGPIAVDRFLETNPEGRRYVTNSIPQNQAAENTGVYVVPPRCYFMLGDNRDNSLDSRFDPGMEGQPTGPANCGWNLSTDAYVPAELGMGFVPEQNLEGHAQLILLSWKKGASLFKPWTWVLDLQPRRFFKVLK